MLEFRHQSPFLLGTFNRFFNVIECTFFFIKVYVFLGDYHALIDFVRSLDKQPKNSGEYVVITVLDEQPTSKLKHFLKSEFSRSFFYVVFPLEKFSLLGEVNTISDHEWLKIQTYVIGAHGNLSSDSSLACHIYCDS